VGTLYPTHTPRVEGASGFEEAIGYQPSAISKPADG